ncbi:MAG: CBS domain-containing protein [Patescibacteria group bacterium]|nr:CBS domain-containing protein [Patescibacteria group bacterium]
MEEKKFYVKDFMSTRQISIKKTATLKEAVAVMITEKTNGLVVTNGENNIAGIISSWDIVKHVVPDYLENEDHLSSFEAEAVFTSRVNEVANDSIENFMTKNVHTAHPSDTLMEAAAILAEHGIRQLPVIDENKKYIGYINRTDIKRAIGDILNIN